MLNSSVTQSLFFLTFFHVQLKSMKFSMLINVRGQTIISVLTFNSVIITTSECLKARIIYMFPFIS